jgi:hypothetical protein
MAKFRTIKNSLITGEISATADGRTDLAAYAHSCKIMRNMVPFTSGGAYIRPGTIYQNRQLFSDYGAPMVFPFTSAAGVEYAIVLYPIRSGMTKRRLAIYESDDSAGGEVFAIV